MSLNLDIIGRKYEWKPFIYNEDNVILYALSIGAGVEDLDFVYEKILKVFPTFGCVTDDLSVMFQMYEDVGINLPTVVHAEDNFISHNVLPTSGVIYRTMVYPGETLITEGWEDESGKYIIQVRKEDGTIVLGNAVAEVV